MTNHETRLRSLAKDLAEAYAQLDDIKTARAQPPEVRVMAPRPGPQTPGDWLAIATSIDCEQRLREVAFDALGSIGVKLRDGDAKARRLCTLIAFYAYDISKLDWVDAIIDELETQLATIHKRTEGAHLQKLANGVEYRQTARSICVRLRGYGYSTTPETLRKWAERGKISRTQRADGKGLYLLTEVMRLISAE